MDYDDLNVQIGQLLKDLREDRGWSLREFGLVIGMNKTYLGDIELGEAQPDGEEPCEDSSRIRNDLEGVLRQDAGLMNAPVTLLEQHSGACYNAR